MFRYTYGQKLFLFLFGLFIMELLITMFLALHSRQASEAGYVLVLLLLGLMFLETLRLISPVWHSRSVSEALLILAKQYSDIWQLLFGVHIVLSIVVVLMWLLELPRIEIVLAFSIYLRWLGMLNYFRAFEGTGPLVRMVVGITHDIRYFILVLLPLVVCATGSAVFILLREKGTTAEIMDYDNYFISLFLSFEMLAFAHIPLIHNASDSQNWPILVIFLLSLVLVTVVLMNLLIALMNDSYERIQEHSNVEFYRLRASVILEIEQLMPSKWKEDKRWFPPVLHALVRRNHHAGTTDAEEWSSMVGAIKSHSTVAFENLEARQLASQNKLMARLKHLEDHLDASKENQVKLMKDFQGKMAGIEAKLDSLLEMTSKRV